jgi:hypothetical protein
MRFLALWLWIFGPSPAAPRPRPALTPVEVVETVTSALRDYNSPIPNAGVFTAYCFASPANQAVTGPYGHFMGLVKSGDFAPLLHHYPSETAAITIHGDHAEQIVTVHLDGSHDEAFKFSLSRQNSGPCLGCWMVDGVSRVTRHA